MQGGTPETAESRPAEANLLNFVAQYTINEINVWVFLIIWQQTVLN